MSMLIRKRQLAAKIELSGIAETLLAADAGILVSFSPRRWRSADVPTGPVRASLRDGKLAGSVPLELISVLSLKVRVQ